MTAAWQTAALEPDVRIRFALVVEGLPQVFLDGPVPLAPDGTEWPAPAETATNDYVWVEDAFDPDTSPVKDVGAEVTRSKADVSSASMLFALCDDHADTLLNLFSRFRTSRLSTLAASVDYGGSTVDLPLDDATGWTVGDLVYFGRETLEVASISGDTLTCTRNLFDALGDGDCVYDHNAQRPSAPRVVASFPRVWHGRYVRVLAYIVDADGIASDAELDLTLPTTGYTWEVWRGTLDGNPTEAANGLSWELRATSIEAALHSSVGIEARAGSLMRLPYGLQANRAGTAPKPDGAPANQALVYVTEDDLYLHYAVVEFASLADALDYSSPVATYDHMAGSAFGFATLPQLMPQHNLRVGFQQLAAEMASDTSGGLSAGLDIAAKGVVFLQLQSTGSAAYRVTVNWDAPRSIGPLLGMTGTVEVVVFDRVRLGSPNTPLGLSITTYATSLPFFLAATTSGAEPLAGGGYARIGDGETAEIVSYAAIEALTSGAGSVEYLGGMYQMTGVRRGLFGTAPIELRVPIGVAENTEEVKVTFGIGFEGVNAFEALLQLATSTGHGHHGDYDTLAAGANAPIRPSHFATAAFQQAMQRFTPEEAILDVFLAKPLKLSELIGQWLAPTGRYCIASTGPDGLYQIRVAEVGAPLESSSVTLTAADVSADARPKRRPGAAEVVNEVRCEYRYDNREDDWQSGSFVLVSDVDSIAEYGRRSGVEWRLRGLRLDPASAHDLVQAWAQNVFARYGRPYEVLELQLGRRGWFLRPGETVRLQLEGIADLTGGRSLDQLATVLKVAKSYSGDTVGATVSFVMEAPSRASAYAPCARVTAYSGATPSITLSTDEFSLDPSRPDYSWFDAGMVVYVYLDEADASTRVQRTIISRSGAVCVLSSSVAGLVAGATTLVVWADYGSAATDQRAHAYITPNANVFGSAPADAYRYA